MRAAAACVLLLLAAPVHAQSIADLWQNNCANCHGRNGQGGGAGTRTLLDDEKFDQSFDRPFFDAIKNGLPDTAMPSYANTMSDEKIWGLVVYIRELQGKERRARLGSPTATNGVYTTRRASYRIEDVIPSGVRVPWSVAFLPDGGPVAGMLVTERPGPVRVFKDGKLSDPIEGTPRVRNRGQGGMMDVAPHPDFARNGWVYLSYSDPLERNGRTAGMTRIIRGKLVPRGDGYAWTEEVTIFQAKPEHYSNSDIHFGSRIVFQPAEGEKWYMYFAIGERGSGELAQRLDRPNGKIYRVWDDGSIPSDNPFVGREGVYEQIWSYGHRNPQGLAFDLNGTLWDTEHGPRGGDEVNPIQRAANYGWPEVAFSINYDGSAFRTPWAPGGKAKDGAEIVMPVDRWLPSCGACGLDVVSGDAFPDWRGDLLGGGLVGENIDRFRIVDGVRVEREEIFHGHGRVRDVVCGPDGFIYIALNDPDKVVRLVPAK